MKAVSIQGLKKKFANLVTVSDMNMDIAEGELVTLLGPSGCGKTTTLRMVAGFIEPTEGRIYIGGEDVTQVPVNKRGTAMVFQRYALFPHMTVKQNISFGLEMHKVPQSERDTRINNVLDMLHMPELKNRYPRQLSGGQQQRVAVARALAVEPNVFLLDEPLSNLDAKLRLEVREELRSIQQRLGLTTLFVTHDQEEALAIADRVAIMSAGKVQQLGAPQELYDRPANLFVASFLGRMNFLSGKMNGDHEFLCESGTKLITNSPLQKATILGVRPERIVLRATPSNHANCLLGTVKSSMYLGSQFEVNVHLNESDVITAHVSNTAATHEKVPMDIGAQIYACFEAHDSVLFKT